jgi:heme-degrading monooxygenase HmoA
VIARLWHGWTSAADAPAYEKLLASEIPAATRAVPGFRGARVLRRDAPSGEVEFVTLLLFDSMAAVRGFAGNDLEKAVLMPGAAELLARYDQRSAHYTVVLEFGHQK